MGKLSNSSNTTNNKKHNHLIIRSEPGNPYPTTYVQADKKSFKQVVQMLTGSSKPNTPLKNSASFKLYERRRNAFKIDPLRNPTCCMSKSDGTLLSPSTLDFPGLILSPVTPLLPDPFGEDEAEEKGFYLRRSPRDCGDYEQPRLLDLFPTTTNNNYNYDYARGSCSDCS